MNQPNKTEWEEEFRRELAVVYHDTNWYNKIVAMVTAKIAAAEERGAERELLREQENFDQIITKARIEALKAVSLSFIADCKNDPNAARVDHDFNQMVGYNKAIEDVIVIKEKVK